MYQECLIFILASRSEQETWAHISVTPAKASNHCEQDPSTTQGCKLQRWAMLTQYCRVMWCTLAWKALFPCTQTSEKGAEVTQGVFCLFFFFPEDSSPLWWLLCLIRIWPTQSDRIKYGERAHKCILLRSREGSQHVSQQERDWRSVQPEQVLKFWEHSGFLE